MQRHHVILHTKPECHLCDTARAWLDEFAAAPEQYALFDLDEIDIRHDPALFAEYRYRIPVITSDGTIIAEGRMDDTAYLQLAHALRKTP